MKKLTPVWILTVTGCHLVAFALLLAGCDGNGTKPPAPPASRPVDAGAMSSSVKAATDHRPSVAFLGDSLTAGYGLPAEQAFPAVLGKLLEQEGLPIRVLNAGVSGDTTAGGLRRVDWVLGQKPDIVLIGLGGNDGLRALEPSASEANLRKIIQKCRDANAAPVLLGMLIPPNYGPDYIGQFREIYPRLAQEMQVPLVPFLLEGVGGEPKLNLPDGIHPTAEGHARVAQTVLPYLRSEVQRHARNSTGAATQPVKP